MARSSAPKKRLEQYYSKHVLLLYTLPYLSLEQALGFGVVLLPHAREDVAHDVLRDHHDLVDLVNFQR